MIAIIVLAVSLILAVSDDEDEALAEGERVVLQCLNGQMRNTDRRMGALPSRVSWARCRAARCWGRFGAGAPPATCACMCVCVAQRGFFAWALRLSHVHGRSACLHGCFATSPRCRGAAPYAWAPLVSCAWAMRLVVWVFSLMHGWSACSMLRGPFVRGRFACRLLLHIICTWRIASSHVPENPRHGFSTGRVLRRSSHQHTTTVGTQTMC